MSLLCPTNGRQRQAARGWLTLRPFVILLLCWFLGLRKGKDGHRGGVGGAERARILVVRVCGSVVREFLRPGPSIIGEVGKNGWRSFPISAMEGG